MYSLTNRSLESDILQDTLGFISELFCSPDFWFSLYRIDIQGHVKDGFTDKRYFWTLTPFVIQCSCEDSKRCGSVFEGLSWPTHFRSNIKGGAISIVLVISMSFMDYLPLHFEKKQKGNFLTIVRTLTHSSFFSLLGEGHFLEPIWMGWVGVGGGFFILTYFP